MNTKELIKILQQVDPEIPIGISLYRHTYFSNCHENSHGKLKVSLFKTWNGNHIVIGTHKIKNHGCPNSFAIKDLL